MSQINFNWELSISHIITITLIITACVATFIRYESKVDQVERDIIRIETKAQTIAEQSASSRQMEDLNNRLDDIQEDIRELRSHILAESGR